MFVLFAFNFFLIGVIVFIFQKHLISDRKWCSSGKHCGNSRKRDVILFSNLCMHALN